MAFTVRDIYAEAKKILGGCDAATIYEKITQAVEVLSNSGDFDPLMGFVDLCVSDGCVVLPREVDTVLAVNVGGHPVILRDMLYRFHLNGLGDCGTPCGYSVEDGGLVPCYRELAEPSKLICFVDEPSDTNKELWAYGYAEDGTWIRSLEGGVWYDGYRVPTIYNYALPGTDAPTFARIVRFRKAQTNGCLRVSSFTATAVSPTLVGYFEPDETDPQYRKIKVTAAGQTWVRIAYRKRIYRVKSLDDLIPLPGTVPLLMMLRSLKAYDQTDLAEATGFETTARRLLTEAAWAHSPVTPASLQVNPNVSVGGTEEDQLE